MLSTQVIHHRIAEDEKHGDEFLSYNKIEVDSYV